MFGTGLLPAVGGGKRRPKPDGLGASGSLGRQITVAQRAGLRALIPVAVNGGKALSSGSVLNLEMHTCAWREGQMSTKLLGNKKFRKSSISVS